MAYSRCVSLDCMKLIVPKGDYCSVSAGYVTFGIPLTENECQTDHRVSIAMETQCSSYGLILMILTSVTVCQNASIIPAFPSRWA